MKGLKIQAEYVEHITCGNGTQTQAIQHRDTKEILCEWMEEDGALFLGSRITPEITFPQDLIIKL